MRNPALLRPRCRIDLRRKRGRAILLGLGFHIVGDWTRPTVFVHSQGGGQMRVEFYQQFVA